MLSRSFPSIYCEPTSDISKTQITTHTWKKLPHQISIHLSTGFFNSSVCVTETTCFNKDNKIRHLSLTCKLSCISTLVQSDSAVRFICPLEKKTGRCFLGHWMVWTQHSLTDGTPSVHLSHFMCKHGYISLLYCRTFVVDCLSLIFHVNFCKQRRPHTRRFPALFDPLHPINF